MKIQAEILKEHSKKQANKIIRWIGDDQERFNQLVQLFLEGQNAIPQRAGWPLSDIAIAHPHLVTKHLKKLLLNLDKPGLHNAVVRNTFRLMQFVKIPKPLHGLTVETSFRFFNDMKQPIAIRVFAMTVLGNLCKEYPDLRKELKFSIEEQFRYGTTGFCARAKKVLKQISS